MYMGVREAEFSTIFLLDLGIVSTVFRKYHPSTLEVSNSTIAQSRL